MAVFCLACWLGLSACGSKPSPPAPAEPEPVTATQPLIDPEYLRQQLDAAQTALDQEHLTFPKRGSAFAIYSAILEKDPEQDEARRGLEHIVERYVELALAALEREQYASARSMLARGRLILPEHPSIEPTAAQIRLLQGAERKKLTLSTALIGNSEALAAHLAELLANPQRAGECRFKIWATSDRAGRQIYQSLSRAYAAALGLAPEETPRLKAQLAVRSPSSVERICFKPV